MAETQTGEVSLRILIVDDDPNLRTTLASCLEADGHSAAICTNIGEALDQVTRQVFDLIFLDVRVGPHGGLDQLPSLIADCPWTKIVVMTTFSSVSTAVKAMKLGASDYLTKPFTPTQVQLVTQKVAERRRMELKIDSLQSALGAMDPEADLYTENAEMQRAARPGPAGCRQQHHAADLRRNGFREGSFCARDPCLERASRRPVFSDFMRHNRSRPSWTPELFRLDAA